ncbi:MAG: hypothetical protein DMG65_23415 [Candidatus Angelobacter sp. Gp1-AA117]|nr:MAG: hypothetical protein DMG65_23415 [Candidatus Angelobacter sp. Gp1-AA117]
MKSFNRRGRRERASRSGDPAIGRSRDRVIEYPVLRTQHSTALRGVFNHPFAKSPIYQIQPPRSPALPLSRSFSIVLVLLLAGIAASAQTVTVRLYSLHAEHHIKFTARSTPLSWRSCDQCKSNSAPELLVAAQGKNVGIGGKDTGHPEILIQGDYRLVPEEGLSFSLASPLRVKAANGLLTVLATIPTEEYVAAALAGESGNFQQRESLKAMAVAIRTYAAHFRQRHQGDGFDFCDSTHCQALNFKGISAEARTAAAATRGEMLWYAGAPAATFYDQNCGGTVAAAHEAWPTMQAPYLKQQADPYCLRGTPLPWKAGLERSQLEAALRAAGLKFPESWNSLQVASRSSSGRVLKLTFRSPSGPPQFVSGSSFRFAIGRSLGWNQVRSDLYEVAMENGRIVFTGHGAGHGVGLCQAGAEEMAKEGKGYREILAFYYPGTSLRADSRELGWQKRESENFELLSTQPDQDAELMTSAQSILSALESELGWKLNSKTRLKVYPTLDAYRDATGQPGWIAAFTRGHVISLQPLATLKQKNVLESTLRHEFGHLLIESRAHPSTPLWFREGLVIYLTDSKHVYEPVHMKEAEIDTALHHPEDRQRLEQAYAAARTRITELIQQNGRETVLQWLNNGR